MINLRQRSNTRSSLLSSGSTIMRPDPAGWVLRSLIGFVFIGLGGGLHADEPPSDKMLEHHGLKRSGPLFVLEAEAPAHAKAEEVRDLSRQWSHAVAQQRATVSEKEYQDTIKELTNELNQLRAESNVVAQNLNRIPKRRGYPVYVQEFQELTVYRNQLQMEISQRTNFLNQLKSKPFDPKERARADAEVRTRQEAMHQGALELRKLVDEIHAKYAAVGADPQVKKWLDTPEGHAGVKPKLGPSRVFLQDEKLLERVERDSAADEAFAPAQKAARKSRRTTKAKRPAVSGNAGSPF
jgi:hypothetical protein